MWRLCDFTLWKDVYLGERREMTQLACRDSPIRLYPAIQWICPEQPA